MAVGIRQYSCNRPYQRIIIPESSWQKLVGGHANAGPVDLLLGG
jgi:hypothetical protein